MSLSRKEKLIFLAGVFEGEGTMGYWKNGITKNGKVMRRIQCAVKMTDKDIIDRFMDYFNCGHVLQLKQKENHHKICWSWRITGSKALQVLEQMLPYFGLRRSKKYYDMVKSFRDSIQNGSHVIREQTKRETSNLPSETNACGENGSW